MGNCGQVGHNQTKCWELPQSVYTPVPASALAPAPQPAMVDPSQLLAATGPVTAARPVVDTAA